MKRIVFGLAALLIIATPAFAQVSPQAVSGAWHSATFVSAVSAPKAAAMGGGKGFTVAVDAGLGIQHDPFFAETKMGFGGVNVEAGWFVSGKVAILGRVTGTRVTFDGDPKQGSGVAGGIIQFWPSNKVAIEAGGGYGWWTDKFVDGDTEKDNGFGLMFGARFVVFNRGAHHILVGAEFAPVLTTDKVYNFSVLGVYQFFKHQ